MPGAGNQSAGSSPAGWGPPAVGTPSATGVLRDGTTGAQQTGRKIDPVTRQYVFDASGRIVGESETRQLVYLALATERGSCVLTTLGHRLRDVKTIGDNYAERVRGIIEEALRPLTQAGKVDLLSVTTQRFGRSGLRPIVRFRDRSTGEEYTRIL